jgi:lipoyl(octanoyl) transferase
MPPDVSDIDFLQPSLEAFLLGQIDFDVALGLQQRLVEQARDRGDGQITLLLCEHPPIITVGRGGSPGQVAMQNNLVRNRQIEVRWVNRGGGCLVHSPGQLAIYPLVPLRWHGLSVGQFLHRLQTAIIETLDDLNIPSRPGDCPNFRGDCPNLRPSENGTVPLSPNAKSLGATAGSSSSAAAQSGVYGRTGQLAALGAAVRHWTTYYGAYLNVCPPTGLFRLVEIDPAAQTSMSSLVAERCGPVRMTGVRSALVRRLAESLGCDRYHLYTGHPMLRRKSQRDPNGATEP